MRLDKGVTNHRINKSRRCKIASLLGPKGNDNDSRMQRGMNYISLLFCLFEKGILEIQGGVIKSKLGVCA